MLTGDIGVVRSYFISQLRVCLPMNTNFTRYEKYTESLNALICVRFA